MKTAAYLKKKMSDLGVTAEVLPPMIGITLRPHSGAETIMQGRNILLVSGENTCRLKHRIRRAFRKICRLSKIIRGRLNIF
ncbi:MAG: hypothetical protein LBL90_02440 [Prevotellaceae bacterium]|jgi:hypothetical protein|nr:hypothetical protein [Prevotellaceae bacterium]